MSRIKMFDISLSRKEIIFISDLLKSYTGLFTDSEFVDINCSPGLKVLDDLRQKFDLRQCIFEYEKEKEDKNELP